MTNTNDITNDFNNNLKTQLNRFGITLSQRHLDDLSALLAGIYFGFRLSYSINRTPCDDVKRSVRNILFLNNINIIKENPRVIDFLIYFWVEYCTYKTKWFFKIVALDNNEKLKAILTLADVVKKLLYEETSINPPGPGLKISCTPLDIFNNCYEIEDYIKYLNNNWHGYVMYFIPEEVKEDREFKDKFNKLKLKKGPLEHKF